MKNRLVREHRNMFEEDDVNPMSGVSNLADVMLVLAVGIMLALIMNFHISINNGSVTQMDEDSMKEVDQSELTTTQGKTDENSGSNLQEKGTVYVDNSTGKMYLVEPNDQ